jgi:hypothetical protein
MSTPNPTNKKKFKAQVMECADELLPNFPEMDTFFKQMGSLPAVMTLQLSELPTCIALALWDDIKSIVITPLDAMEDFLGALSVTLPSQTTNTVRDRPDEWRRRADDLQENYKLYFMLGLINLLGTFASHILQIPLPLLPEHTVGDLLDEEGRKRIGETIRKKFDSLKLLVPDPFRSLINGDYGTFDPEESWRNFKSWWKTETKKTIKNPLIAVFKFLIKKFKTIWKSLNLPSIPDFSDLKAEDFLNFIIQPYIERFTQEYETIVKPLEDAKKAADAAKAKKEGKEEPEKSEADALKDYIKSQITLFLGEIIDKILAIGIPVIGLTLGDLLGYVENYTQKRKRIDDLKKQLKELKTDPVKNKDAIESTQAQIDDLQDDLILNPQKVLAKLGNKLGAIFEDIVMVILEQWIQKVKKFLDKIGLGAIFSLVPLTFCKFLKLVVPQLFSLGSTMQGIIDSATSTIAQVDKLNKDLAILSQDPEKNKLAIQEIKKQLAKALPIPFNCTPT